MSTRKRKKTKPDCTCGYVAGERAGAPLAEHFKWCDGKPILSQGEQWLLDAERKGEIRGLLSAARLVHVWHGCVIECASPCRTLKIMGALEEQLRAEAAKLRKAAR